MLDAAVNKRSNGRTAPATLADEIRQCRDFPAVFERPCRADPFTWLAAQPHAEKLVWGDRGSRSVAAGLGSASRIVGGPYETASSVLERCRHLLQGLPNQRFYGGFAFRRDQSFRNSDWQSFGNATFWLPRAVLFDECLRVVVLDADDAAEALRFLGSMVEVRDSAGSGIPPWIERHDLPARSRWTESVAQAMNLFRDEVLEKIVLARQVDFTFARPLNPVQLLSQLAPATPACYHFCFQTAPHTAFVGASPERLFRREGRQLLSEVVAGTRPRGSTPLEDVRLSHELLASSKDQLEHDIVRKSIRQRLHACVDSLVVDAKATLLQLATKQHLYSQVVAQLGPRISDGELIERLHPTPAVGGYPTENALEEIRRLEPFERGWYAAPVGWVAADAAEFAVAIRSGLIHQDRLSLYSGAGIVPGSTADSEWDEIEHKISDFLHLLTPALPTSHSTAT